MWGAAPHHRPLDRTGSKALLGTACRSDAAPLNPTAPAAAQNVKNHLQKQRTKEAKAGGGGRRASSSRRSADEEEDLDDADPMDSGEGPGSAGGAGPAPPHGAPALWLPEAWAAPLVRAPGGGAGGRGRRAGHAFRFHHTPMPTYAGIWPPMAAQPPGPPSCAPPTPLAPSPLAARPPAVRRHGRGAEQPD